MVSLGEMATHLPITGAFTAYATRFIDPSLGFAMGWIYWYVFLSQHVLAAKYGSGYMSPCYEEQLLTHLIGFLGPSPMH